MESMGEKMKAGPKLVQRRYKGEQIDLYLADENTWSTLVLIRTGSKEHNKTLCARAKTIGGKLHADGSGIDLPGLGRCQPRDEADVFRLLGLPYKAPRERI